MGGSWREYLVDRKYRNDRACRFAADVRKVLQFLKSVQRISSGTFRYGPGYCGFMFIHCSAYSFSLEAHKMEWIKNMITGKDNITVDFLRVLAIASIVVALALQVYVVVFKVVPQPFDLQQFGIGIGVVLASAAGALKLKETTEP